jgi:glycosyltransferase involved in cell wall biosynthesis
MDAHRTERLFVGKAPASSSHPYGTHVAARRRTETVDMANEPLLASVIVATYNRARQLERALESLVRQRVDRFTYEILVVDNNSTDDTSEVVRRIARRYPDARIEYLFVREQGVSHARNAGIVHARAPLIAFIDDDVEAADDWLARMVGAFAEHPEVACVGGQVRPRWTTGRPSWLTEDHFGPLALQTWSRPFLLSRAAAERCLATENFGCRRAVFEEVGLFSAAFPRGEDREFQLRLWQAGKCGLYDPGIKVSVSVPTERLTRAYHRKWRFTYAKYHALMWYRDLVNGEGVLEPPTRRRSFLGTPLFIYREGVAHGRGWCAALLHKDGTRRFYHETQLWYVAGFVYSRLQQTLAAFVRGQSVRGSGIRARSRTAPRRA